MSGTRRQYEMNEGWDIWQTFYKYMGWKSPKEWKNRGKLHFYFQNRQKRNADIAKQRCKAFFCASVT